MCMLVCIKKSLQYMTVWVSVRARQHTPVVYVYASRVGVEMGLPALCRGCFGCFDVFVSRAWKHVSGAILKHPVFPRLNWDGVKCVRRFKARMGCKNRIESPHVDKLLKTYINFMIVTFKKGQPWQHGSSLRLSTGRSKHGFSDGNSGLDSWIHSDSDILNPYPTPK